MFGLEISLPRRARRWVVTHSAKIPYLISSSSLSEPTVISSPLSNRLNDVRRRATHSRARVNIRTTTRLHLAKPDRNLDSDLNQDQISIRWGLFLFPMHEANQPNSYEPTNIEMCMCPCSRCAPQGPCKTNGSMPVACNHFHCFFLLLPLRCVSAKRCAPSAGFTWY